MPSDFIAELLQSITYIKNIAVTPRKSLNIEQHSPRGIGELPKVFCGR